MKNLRNVLVAICLIAGIAVLVFLLQFRAMTKAVNEQMTKVEAVNLGNLDNGVYAGGFSKFFMGADARVAVADSAILSVDIVDQKCGKGYEALETVDRIVQAQSPKVDAVSGATGSSFFIMIAVHRALTSEPVQRIASPIEAVAPIVDPTTTVE